MEQEKKMEAEQVVEAPVVEKKPSRLSVLRDLLAEEDGYTMEELAEQSGVKLSTVKCQIYFHLKNNGNPCERLSDKKYRLMRGEKLDEYISGIDVSDNGEATKAEVHSAQQDAENDIQNDIE